MYHYALLHIWKPIQNQPVYFEKSIKFNIMLYTRAYLMRFEMESLSFFKVLAGASSLRLIRRSALNQKFSQEMSLFRDC
jgi:hypothetical protein